VGAVYLLGGGVTVGTSKQEVGGGKSLKGGKPRGGFLIFQKPHLKAKKKLDDVGT